MKADKQRNKIKIVGKHLVDGLVEGIKQRDVLGGTMNAYSEWVMDLCPECMNEFEKFMTAKLKEK